MVKIKDFTLASQNLGGGHVPPPPCPTHRAPMVKSNLRPVHNLPQACGLRLRVRTHGKLCGLRAAICVAAAQAAARKLQRAGRMVFYVCSVGPGGCVPANTQARK